MMTGRASLSLWLVGLLTLLAGCTSEDGSPRITGATAIAPERLPDFNDPAELERAVVSFGECVEQSFPIVVRFRADAFNGMSTEVSSQSKEDDDRVESVTAECKSQLDLERRLGVYQSEYPISPADRRQLVDVFVSCALMISPEISSRVSEANLDSETAVMDFVSELDPQDLTQDGLIGMSDCHSEMTGPEWVFADGHPWFTP
jgi:hypothetical protein